ncbi:MAG: hypothetical protein HZA78_11410 [Candidatus Schekmanbacteria bacterium]|nr:hypothetical protein [Candidatus Schekmanbacteria bacterium]
MGHLTDDMNRLHDEIIAGHEGRKAFVADIQHNVAKMRADFQNANTERSKNVSGMLADVRADMAGGYQAFFGKSKAA